MADNTITWGPICECGKPRVPHRHGTSAGATHISIPVPHGERK